MELNPSKIRGFASSRRNGSVRRLRLLIAVRDLYKKMNDRLEQLESAHFERANPAKTRFVLKAFPEKAAVKA
jgi:hypothetical protein